MTIEELYVVTLRDGGGDDVCIKIILVAGQQGEFALHIRDTAGYSDPFTLEAGRTSREGGSNMDAMGVRVIKSKAKESFYRHYGGFNSLVVKIQVFGPVKHTKDRIPGEQPMKKFVGINPPFIAVLSFTIYAMTVFGLDRADVNGQYGEMVTGIRVSEIIYSIAKGELQKKREEPAGNKGSPQNE